MSAPGSPKSPGRVSADKQRNEAKMRESREAREEETAAEDRREEVAASPASAQKETSVGEPKQRLGKKKKFAVLFGYCGRNYCGLQRNFNPDAPTIEDVVHRAFYKAGLIHETNMQGNSFLKIQWERASRTDKGVSALRNVLSVKLHETPSGGTEAMKQATNKHLPDDIRVYSIQPAINSFNSYQHCSGRKYGYYIPSYAFLGSGDYRKYFPTSMCPHIVVGMDGPLGPIVAPKEPGSGAPTASAFVDSEAAEDGGEADGEDAETGGKNKGRGSASVPSRGVASGAEDGAFIGVKKESQGARIYASIPDDCYEKLQAYRIPPSMLSTIRELFAKYDGTHSFHNFTPGGKPTDASMTRYMKAITVSDPVVVDGTEWLKITLAGQSFLYNQIRKMIAAVAFTVALNRDNGEREFALLLSKTLERKVPMVPANGLMLEELYFDTYNAKLSSMKETGCGQGKDVLEFKLGDDGQVMLDELERTIRGTMVDHEAETRAMARWTRSIPHMAYSCWEVALE